MKVWNALASSFIKKDNAPVERFNYNKVGSTIEKYCQEYLTDNDSQFTFEALPDAIDLTLEFLDSTKFQEVYEYAQISPTCFTVKLRELNII